MTSNVPARRIAGVDAASGESLHDEMPAPHFLGGGQIGTWTRSMPRPGAGELLVRVRANAICGSERDQYLKGSNIVPGHEAAGEVVSVGDAVSTPVGTHGIVYLMDYCGACRSCLAGATNQCTAKRADMGFTHDGGYGPYEHVHESNFFRVPADLDLAEATLLLDVMGTTGHALRRAMLPTPDIRAIAVSGAGPLGLGLVVMAGLLIGRSVPVLVGDVQPARLRLVEKLGGRPIDLRETTLLEGLHGYGVKEVDAAVDTAGRSASRQSLLAITARRGVLVCVGHGEDLTVAVSEDLISPERSVLGSEYFRYDELPGNLELLLTHRDELAPIITHRFPVTELGGAFELFMSGVTGKVVVEQ
jgi:threonine 3-dehydrogenase